jgi:hypothetical protein
MEQPELLAEDIRAFFRPLRGYSHEELRIAPQEPKCLWPGSGPNWPFRATRGAVVSSSIRP